MFWVSGGRFLRRTDQLVEVVSQGSVFPLGSVLKLEVSTARWSKNPIDGFEFVEVVRLFVCANNVCLCVLVVANMGQECAVPVRLHHDRHSFHEWIGIIDLYLYTLRLLQTIVNKVSKPV